MKKYRTAIILFVVFEAIAVSLWLATGNLFFLLNFTYIGTCIGVGGLLVAAEKKYAREFVQFGMGAYMLVFLGLICKENMQIEGFWYYLLSGVAGAGVLHYAICLLRVAHPLRRKQVRSLRQMSGSLSDGRGGKQRLPQAPKRHGVQPLQERMSRKGAEVRGASENMPEG